MQNKVAVITGATSGIGAAYASKFAQRGYDLVITGRRKEKIEAVTTQIQQEYNLNVELDILPRKSYYKFMYNFSRKNFGKKDKTE